ncbi:MAG: hypothetical protein BWY36_00752 [Candidatus Diapherotrites archaeon ADurb.Bin253]|jgi:hypothetical protein|nr:YggU family protein [Candidatus Pacearchaeota archaeon]OQA67244.1 MAG: hypothetical protein BWY36_00752 [Candidatus Diapherotrites archaeon ADurb.Bin253]HOC97032.1 DUF167 domain-containing protein [Candidatus Pacearchaeota archaeon]HOF44528.1 DUF167 domain-containing protein [Candidatus Pacearchaeota archaeon]HOH04505.1 DUF167 domain-containing protein [Candidatus Pacearchaeota archaeon]
MKVKIKLHPNSSQEKIKEVEKDKSYEVWIKEKPIDGKANKELIKILKKHFKKDVKITSGFTSRDKIIELS